MRLRGWLCAVIVGGVLALVALPAAAQVQVEVILDGRDIADAGNSDPIPLEPQEEIPLQVTITNNDDEPLTVRFVRLEGEALGLTFLTYDLGVRTTIPPGESTEIDVILDFFDLGSQATGYLGTSLRVYDEDRNVVASESFVVDVRGSATSTLGLFAIVILVIAVVSVVLLVVMTIRRRLPANRFLRGLQFAIAGAAVGLTLALGVSILRLTFVDVEAWVPLVFLPTVIGFILGYLAPGPLSQSIEEVREEEELDLAAEEAVARVSGRHTAEQTGGQTAAQTGAESARFSHDSGGQRTSQGSGGYEPARESGPLATHESGGHEPHESGGFTPQESGDFKPVDDESDED